MIVTDKLPCIKYYLNALHKPFKYGSILYENTHTITPDNAVRGLILIFIVSFS